MKEILKLGLVLMVIGAAAAGVLTMTNGVTAPIIAEQMQQEKMEALALVLPDAGLEFTDLTAELSELLSDPKFSGIITEVWGGFDSSGAEAGTVYVVAPMGYGGSIVTLVGIAADSKLTGVKILSAGQETPGLGLAVTEQWFADRFSGRDLNQDLTVTKTEPSRPNEIQAVTAATISSSAVVRGVNAAAAFHRARGQEASVSADADQSRQLAQLVAADEFRDVTENSRAQVQSAGGGQIVNAVWLGRSGKETIGYVIGTTTRGFGGAISLLVGCAGDGAVTGLRVISMAQETPDIGGRIADAEFTDQFVGRVPGEELALAKRPTGASNEIVALTGATLSSRAVVDGVNVALAVVSRLIAGGGE